jgi:hypothetical protein
LWIIAPTGAAQITISFTEFLLEPTNDVVRLYTCMDINCTANLPLAVLDKGNYSTIQSFNSMTGYIMVTFTTDEQNTRAGWTATWTSSQVAATKVVSFVMLCHLLKHLQVVAELSVA